MLDQLQRAIKYHFNELKLLEQAITHSSFSNEQNAGLPSALNTHNERLEFLGDAVLQLASSAELFTLHPNLREGNLTHLRSRVVSTKSLAQIAKKINLDRYLFLGKGEESQGGRLREGILADTLEAIFGAIYLDSNFEAAKKVICELLSDCWLDAPAQSAPQKDNKSHLQEIIQKRFKNVPVYKLINSSGPEHEKVFTVSLKLPDGRTIEATAGTVKKAEQSAAKIALAFFEGSNSDK